MAINAPVALEASQQIRIYNRKLQTENLLYDPWTFSQGIHSTSKKMAIPDAVYIKLEAGAETKAGRVVQWSMIKELDHNPVEGTTTNQVGLEENINTKWTEAYSNDVSHAVPLEEYGLEAVTKAPYRINEQAVQLLNTYKAQLEGRYIRNALVETISANLQQNPHNLAPILNPNFFISGLSLAAQPTYADQAAAAWSNILGTGFVAAGTTATASAKLRDFIKLDEYASTYKYLEPITIGGRETYLTLVPSPQATYLKDPTVTASIGANFTARSALNEEELNYPTVLGRIGRLLLLEDPRYPTLTVGGSAGNYSLTAQYRGMGRGANSDPRDMSATAIQVGMVLGKGAIFELNHEDWHLEYQWENYDKIYGLGIFCTKGWQTPRYKIGTNATATTVQQDSSLMIGWRQPPATWV